jgi:hypothetical protein
MANAVRPATTAATNCRNMKGLLSRPGRLEIASCAMARQPIGGLKVMAVGRWHPTSHSALGQAADRQTHRSDAVDVALFVRKMQSLVRSAVAAMY